METDNHSESEKVLSVWNKLKILLLRDGVSDFQSSAFNSTKCLCCSSLDDCHQMVLAKPFRALVSSLCTRAKKESKIWAMTRSQTNCGQAVWVMSYAYRQAFHADLSKLTMSEQTRTGWAKAPVHVGVLWARGDFTNRDSLLRNFVSHNAALMWVCNLSILRWRSSFLLVL